MHLITPLEVVHWTCTLVTVGDQFFERYAFLAVSLVPIRL